MTVQVIPTGSGVESGDGVGLRVGWTIANANFADLEVRVTANLSAIQTETQRALLAESRLAPLMSPTFTGLPMAPTPAAGDNSTKLATTNYVDRAVAAGGGSGGGGTAYAVTYVAQSLTASQQSQARQNIAAVAAGDSFTLGNGSTAFTQAAGDNTSKIATDAFVTGALTSYANTVSATYLTQSAASATYAPFASPSFTGTPTAPTPALADNSTKLATTAYADRAATSAAAAVPQAPPVRQTVTSGPATNGLPTFLPSTSGTLSLAAQNVTSTVPLIVTAAQGLGATPNVSYNYTSNPTWTGLTANTTNYLYVNALTGATGFTTLPPIYQFGGTPSTANGQFTFDYVGMQGYLGNGSTAVATPLVPIGEAVTSGSAVTSTVAYAYSRFYDSGWTNGLPAANTVTSRGHNLGMQPGRKVFIAECVAAGGDAGYSLGTQLSNDSGLSGYEAGYAVPIALPSTRTGVQLVTTNNPFAAVPGTGAASSFPNLTPASWKWKIVATGPF